MSTDEKKFVFIRDQWCGGYAGAVLFFVMQPLMLQAFCEMAEQLHDHRVATIY